MNDDMDPLRRDQERLRADHGRAWGGSDLGRGRAAYVESCERIAEEAEASAARALQAEWQAEDALRFLRDGRELRALQRKQRADRAARAFWAVTLAFASAVAIVAVVGMTLAYGWPVPFVAGAVLGAVTLYVFGPRWQRHG